MGRVTHMFEIQGTNNSERLEGTSASESIYTGDGADTVLAGAGNDSVNGSVTNGQVAYYPVNGAKLMSGEDGDDFLYGGTGADSISGDAGNDTLYGAAGNDSLSGGLGDDQLRGGDGNDAIDGGDGADDLDTGNGLDSVHGGNGNDNINGHVVNALAGTYTFSAYAGAKLVDAGAGDDFVYGGADNDTLTGGDGNDSLHGAAGNDVLQGDVGDDALSGEDGADSLVGGEGADVIETGEGQDTVLGGNGNDSINGHVVDALAGTYSFTSYAGAKSVDAGAGDDFVYGGTDHDSLSGGDGRDSVHGGDGNDTVLGDAGDDALFGEDGADSLVGGDGADAIDTGEGQDTVSGGNGNDSINGHLTDSATGAYSFQTYAGAKLIAAGAGDDFVYGGTDNDTLLGEAGNDTLHGSEGHDSLDGGRGNDSLSGGTGNDTLASSYGQDTLDGGAGDDRYLIGTSRFTWMDEGGTDTAVVSVDFVKVPSFIEQVSYAAGVQALPYWVSALLPDEAAGGGYLSSLGTARTYAYTFAQSAPSYLETGSDYLKGWSAFTASEIAATKQSLTYIASLVNLTFVQSTVADALNTLSFANNTQTGSAGYALHPSDTALASDVFLNDTAENREAKDGTYAALTLIHEIGHALGLKHPFSEPDSTGDSATPPYLVGAEDSTAWTVMSYDSNAAQYAFEYSPLDIAALQYLYGPSPSSRAGNDTYTVSASAANFVWDGAGVDLLDASALTQAATLYLTPGYWGFVGTAADATITSPGQVTVNFGSTIENLKGSAQADHLYGNASGNAIEGGAGSDVLQGWDGSDTLTGGLGDDTLYGGASGEWGSRNRGVDVAVFSGPRSNYQIRWSAVTDALTVSSTTEGTDTLWDIEQLQFTDGLLPMAALRDSLAPTLLAASPLSGALRVPLDSPVVLKFNETVQPGSGTFTLKSGSTTVASVSVTDSQYVKFEGSTVTINLPANLVSAGTVYTATASAGAIKDLSGNSWVPSSTAYTFTFANGSAASTDTIAPTVDSSLWRKTVSPSSAIQIPFTENIVLGTGKVELIEYDALTKKYYLVPAPVSLSGATLTLTPSKVLNLANSYWVHFSTDAVKDMAGNDFNFQDTSAAAQSDLYVAIGLDGTAPVAPKWVTTAGVVSSVDPQVTFSTTLGDIVMELDSDLAPISTANMMAYVNSGFYDGTLFHRVDLINRVVQGGGFKSNMVAMGPTYGPILNEASNGLSNALGTVGMARTSALNSATSQFFINLNNNSYWDGSYAVFGKVVSDMAVIERMATMPTQTLSSGYENVPVTDITTLKAQQTQQGQWTSTTGLLSLSDLETQATWQYSLNSGVSWLTGSGNYLRVPDGFYAAGSLQVRQTDAQGLVSSAYVFPGSLQVNQTSAYQLTGTTVFWKDMVAHPKALSGVQLSSELPDKTDALGVVDLSGIDGMALSASGTVVLAPSLASPANAKAAISLTDVLAALKIYLGKPVPDAYASPLNYVAADFDASGSVTLMDVLQMLKYYLGKSTTNNVKPEWAFVDAGDLTGIGSTATALGANGQALSKSNAAPHAIDLDLQTVGESVQIVGVLRGDVDGSWIAPVN